MLTMPEKITWNLFGAANGVFDLLLFSPFPKKFPTSCLFYSSNRETRKNRLHFHPKSVLLQVNKFTLLRGQSKMFRNQTSIFRPPVLAVNQLLWNMTCKHCVPREMEDREWGGSIFPAASASDGSFPQKFLHPPTTYSFPRALPPPYSGDLERQRKKGNDDKLLYFYREHV